MKKIVVSTGLFGMALLMANCAKKTTGSLVTNDATYTAAVADVTARYTEEQMREGMTIWQGNCNKCHELYEPGSRSVKRWEKVLPAMSKKANLTADQAGKVRAYLLSNTDKMN